MKLLYFQYLGINTEKIINDVKEKRNLTTEEIEVIFFGYTEWELSEITKSVVDTLRLYNVKITIIHGAGRNEYYENLYNKLGIDIDTEVKFWDTFWFNRTYNSFKHILNQNNTVDFKYKFISLNNRSHKHRCALIEELAKEQLLDKGVVSWIKHLNENSDYPFKYFDNKQRLLGDNFEKILDSSLLPTEFLQSVFHIVAEATPHVFCISEKTAKPILLKRPFIVLGAKGFSKHLTKLGFKLYDEIIDYSFDDENDLLERTRLFVRNIHKIIEYDPNELYKILYPKVQFNYERALEIVDSKDMVPDACFYDKNLLHELKFLNQQ